MRQGGGWYCGSIHKQIRAPAVGGQSGGLANECDSAGTFGWALETQSGLLWGAMPFFTVAGRAGGYQVFPGVLATFAARDNMIESQIRSAGAAVLAAMIVSEEQVFTIQQNPPGRRFNISSQANDSRQSKNSRDCVNSQ